MIGLRLSTLLLCLAAPLAATPGGKLDTLPQGRYTCALPGDAAGEAFVILPDKAFVIDNGSTYRTKNGSGTYLLTGEIVQFTRGPLKGMRFERTSSASLRWIDETGQPGKVRCVRNVR